MLPGGMGTNTDEPEITLRVVDAGMTFNVTTTVPAPLAKSPGPPAEWLTDVVTARVNVSVPV